VIAMTNRSRAVRIGSVFWSILVGFGVIALGFSLILPSTKRARIDFRHANDEQPADVAATEPTTAPAATQPQ